MSNNSNGMYNVLNVFKKLQPLQESTAKEVAKEIYESVEAKGSILEGVSKVEQKLKEEYEKLKTAKGTIHKVGRYGNEYNVGDDGTSKPKVKHVPKTGQKGRPKKEKPAEFNAPKGDIFGRTTGVAPKGKKGTVVKGKANQDTVDETVMESRDQSTSEYTYEIVAKRLADEKPHMDVKSDLFFDEVYDEMVEIGMSPRAARNKLNFDEDFLGDVASCYSHFCKSVEEAVVNPIDVPAVQRKAAGQNFPATMDQVQDTSRNISDPKTLAQNTGRVPALSTQAGDKELNELARLAGLTMEAKKFDPEQFGSDGAGAGCGDIKKEGAKPDFLDIDKDGNKKETFKKAVKDSNLDEAKPDFLDMDKDGDKKEPMKKALDDKEKVDENCMSIMGGAQDMQDQQGKISVNTSASSDGNKTVNISADGEAAEQLMQMLKMAGMGNSEAHAKLVIARPAEIGAEEEVEEATEQYANTPEEEYGSIEQINSQGTDMNRQKKQFADKPRQGDNPMATPESVGPIQSLGRDLMAEYQALKLQK